MTTVRLAADCPSVVAVQMPAAACKSGMATAAVVGIPGATYAWTVDGGQIVGDAGSDHITIALGTGIKATASVTMTAGACVSSGTGVVALHDPFNVRVAAIPAAHASEPLTIGWSYENGSPGQQTISGDFGVVTLAPDARAYTYTPATSGSTQFVIDAVMKTVAASPAPASRQRAVSKSPVSASTCAAAHAAVPYTVGTCTEPAVVVDGPDSVVTGSNFQLSVRPQPGAVAAWTISNGSPATATGDSVMVTPGASGNVDVTVRLTRGACMGRLDRSIAITAKPVCDAPNVFVSTGPLSCGSAILNATFTGTPPFKGMWSDNFPFNTSAAAVVRTVTVPGNYSIIQFEDATCAGPPSGVAIVPALLPTASVYGSANSCTRVDSAIVQFTGKPPFSGCWLDGTCFQTNQMQLTKLLTAAGTNTLSFGTDGAGCPLTIMGAVQAQASPSVQLSRRCEWAPTDGNVADLIPTFNGSFQEPWTVQWSDGVTTFGTRYINPMPLQTTTYTIAGVGPHNGSCAVIFDPPQSFTIYPSPTPDITLDPSDLCTGSTGTASLATAPPPGTQVTWIVQNGTIVSGQGTNSIQYQAGVEGSMGVICTFTFSDPNRCPLTTQRTRRIVPVDAGALLRLLSGGNLIAGQTEELEFWLGYSVVSWSFTDSMNDSITPVGACHADGNPCIAVYTSSHGPGQSTITLHVTGACHTQDIPVGLTILPAQ